MVRLKFRRRVFDYVFLALLITGVVFLVRGLGRDIASSEVYVIDGDSLRLGDVEVRLYGIDAPELAQKCMDKTGRLYDCGRKARQFLKRLVRAGTVTCRIGEYDRYDRAVAVCLAGGRELNQAMVEAGWAIAYLHHSLDYVNAENKARKARTGIWRGWFEIPQEWRRNQRGALITIPDIF